MSSMGIQLLPQQLVPLMPILDAMSDGVLVVDASGSIIAVNKSMRRFYQGARRLFPGIRWRISMPLTGWKPNGS